MPRRQVVRVSVPFAPGEAKPLSAWGLPEHPCSWRPLTHWPDGSPQWAQAQFVAQLAAGERRSFEIEHLDQEVPEREGFVLPERLWATLQRGVLVSEVRDPDGNRYRAGLEPDPSAGPEGLLEESPLVRVYRYRSYHEPVDPEKSIGRDFLSLTAYLTLYSGFEHAELTWVLGNDYQGSDAPGDSKDPNLRPLGLVHWRGASVLVQDPELAFVPRWIHENRIPAPEVLRGESGEAVGWRQTLLPDSRWTLGDGQTKAYRFVLFAPEGNMREAPAKPGEKLARQSATAIAFQPLFALPHVDTIRASGAMNAHGGPAPATGDLQQHVVAEYAKWRSRNHFGPFGTWGDVAATATTGTPRNTPIALHLAARSGNRLAMLMAEGLCLQQAVRAYHLWGLEIQPGQDVFLEGMPKWANGWISGDTLGRRHIPAELEKLREGYRWRDPGPNGVNAYDYEHMTVDALYDFYCLTGDPWAREELRILGEQMRGMLVLDPKYFYGHMFSSRGEGWCMKALVLCYLATGNEALKRHGIARLHEVIDKERGRPPNAYAVSQEPHPNAFGAGVRWDAPWQQAAFVMGMAAAFRYFGDPGFRDAALDVAGYMARQGWKDGVGPKYFVAIDDPSRYSMPKGYSPLGGTAEFEVSAFVLAAELARELGRHEEARLFQSRADRIVHAYPPGTARYANKWFQIYLDRAARR